MFKRIEIYSICLGVFIFFVSALEVAFTIPLAFCLKVVFGGEVGKIEDSFVSFVYTTLNIQFYELVIIAWSLIVVSIILSFFVIVLQQNLLWGSHAKLVRNLLIRISVSSNWDGLGSQNSRTRKIIVTEVQNYSMFWLASLSNIIGRGTFITLFAFGILYHYLSGSRYIEKIWYIFVLLAVLFFVFSLQKMFRIKGKKRENISRKIFSITDEILQNMRVIKILRRKLYFSRKIESELAKFRAVSLSFGVLPHIPRVLIELSVFSSLAGFIIYTSTSDGTVSNEIYVILALARLTPSLNILFRNVADLGVGRAAREELIKLSDLISDRSSRKRAKGQSKILEKLKKSVNEGADKYFIALIKGKSGSGKSTFLNDLLLSEAESANVFNNVGRDTKYGYVPQEVFLLNGDVYENVAFGNEIDKRTINTLLVNVGLRSFVDTTHVLDINGSDLSGGEKQRLGIARCIYSNIDVLLMDEPTAALDPKTECKIVSLIERLATEHIKFVIVTHSNAFDGIASSILDMEQI